MSSTEERTELIRRSHLRLRDDIHAEFDSRVDEKMTRLGIEKIEATKLVKETSVGKILNRLKSRIFPCSKD